MKVPDWLRSPVAWVLGLLVAGGVTFALVDDVGPGPNPTHHRTVTIELGGPGHKSVALPPPAQSIAATQKAQDAAGKAQAAHSDLRSEPPAATSPAVVAHDKALTPPGQPEVPAHPPLATVNTPGCRTLLVRNQSSRNGRPVLIGVLHQTISPDNGWNGVLGNVKWFDTLAAQASSNYIVARTAGQCAYTVPESQKAWAQAGFNSVALSIEVTETGREGSYLPPGPGRDRVISLMIGWHHRWGLPYRHGAVSGCTVVRTGFVEHKDLGQCGGGHVDDSPYSIDPLIAAAAKKDSASPAATLTKARRSHRIVHAKIAKRCRGATRHSDGCRALYKRNGQLHARYGKALAG